MRKSSVDRITYKDYVIWILSYKMKSGGWVPEALMVVTEAEGNGQ